MPSSEALLYAASRRSFLPKKWLRYDRETETLPLSVTQIAETVDILRAGKSLSNIQLEQWAKEGYPGTVIQTFKPGAQNLLTVIASPLPWSFTTIWPDQNIRIHNILILMDFAYQVEQINAKTMTVVPASLFLLIDLLLGRNWQLRYKAAIKKIQQRLQEQEAEK